MNIDDYLPTVLKISKESGYSKYDPGFYAGEVAMLLSFVISSNKDRAIVKYTISTKRYPYKKEDIILYDDIKIDYKDVVSKSIIKFNEKIGNIYDFVDTYEKRKIILLDLI